MAKQWARQYFICLCKRNIMIKLLNEQKTIELRALITNFALLLVHGSVVSQDHRGQINLSFRILWPFLLPSVTPLLPPSSPPPSQPAPTRKQIQNGYNVLPNRIFKHLYLPCSSSAAQAKHHRLAPCLTLLRWKREWDILYWIWNLFLFSSPGHSRYWSIK